MKENSYFVTGVEMIGRVFPPLNFSLFMLYMPTLLDLAQGMSDAKSNNSNRRGYLTLMNGTTGDIMFTVPFGEIPEEKREKYFELSQEKANRLFSQVNMHLPNGHTTSYESRNESEQKYGGAIYLGGHSIEIILSFSGMPELIDEAMMLVLACKISEDIGNPAKKIEAYERNPYWRLLLEKFTAHHTISGKNIP